MKKMALFVLALGLSSNASAGLIVGTTTGPLGSFSINFSFTNLSILSGATVNSLSLDGSTAVNFPIIWDSIGSLSGQTATVSGVDTSLVTFNFTSSWDPLESFGLNGVDPDGVPGPASVTIADLEGVAVTSLFSDGDGWVQSFQQRLFFKDRGLILGAPVAVSEPGTLILILAGFGLMMGRLLRKR